MNDPQVIVDQAVPADPPLRAMRAAELSNRLFADPNRPEMPYEKAQRLLFEAVDELEQAAGELVARDVLFSREGGPAADDDLNPVAQPHTEVTARVRAVTHMLRGTSPSG